MSSQNISQWCPVIGDDLFRKYSFLEFYTFDGGGGFINRALLGSVDSREITALILKQNKLESFGELTDLDFRRFRLGSIPIPTWLVEQIAASELRKRRTTARFRKLDRAVKSLFIDNAGALHILYRPAELRGAVLNF